ncbi:hypothetical protein [uncultured Polaribacter sp.]|uniref:hypothetical protein n=1 Tax=uncultured Polaribacter sp. TaxID=174711 RepID=UPI0030DA17E9|tara:strand:+ start:1562 stop:1756 length:195 start_codon:yes stop_codon:yes gene_type:complete
MKNKEKTLFAIYKNGNHMGNQRGKDNDDAIKQYLIASLYKASLNDKDFKSQYSSKIAIKKVHFS